MKSQGNHLPENLRRAREAAGLSQRALGAKIGGWSSYICDLEHGRRNPTMRSLAKLAAALGTTPAALISPRNGRAKTCLLYTSPSPRDA